MDLYGLGVLEEKVSSDFWTISAHAQELWALELEEINLCQ